MTLSEHYTQRTAALQTRSDELKVTLASKKASQSDQEKDFRFWTDRVSNISAEIKRNENDLLSITTVAEIESIAIELRHLQIIMRASQTKMTKAQDDVSASNTHIDLLIEQTEQLDKELSTSAESLRSLIVMEEKHQTWFAAIAIDPLGLIPAKANALLTGAVQDALDKLEAETSTEFIALATNRLKRYWQRQEDLGEKADSVELGWDANWVTQYGQDGNIDINSRKLDMAVVTLEEFVANGESILQSAESSANKILNSDFLNATQKARFDSLAAVGDISADLLVPEATLRAAEHELILRQRELDVARAIARSNDPSISDADLDDVADVKEILDGADGKDSPADMQANYDSALVVIESATFDTVVAKELAVDDAKSDLKQATKEFLEDNPDDDPDAAPELDAARDVVSGAEAELVVAHSAMRDSPWYKLEELEVAIPNASWSDAMYLVRAQQQLDKLKDVDLTSLEAAITVANEALATAISEESTIDDGFSILNQLINQYREIHQNARARGSEAAFGTARGQV